MTWVRARLGHFFRAGVRYDGVAAGRLAAAVTYYAFFAAFALALLSLAVLGYVLNDPGVMRDVQSYLGANLPRLDAEALREARGTVGMIAFVTLPITGLFWVDSLRSAIRAVWRLDEYPGNFFIRALVDLLVLVGLGILLAVSLALAFGTNALVEWLLIDAAGADPGVTRWPLGVITFALGLAVNTLLSVAVLSGLPRLRMPLRRVIGPALLIAVGLELLKTVGRFYVSQTEANPAYHVVAGAVGLLVFLNLLNQLILFAAALTATSQVGRVTDLAAGPVPQPAIPVQHRRYLRRVPNPRVRSIRRAA
ncbi:MAG TPA: YihY/virulence factor BrkB family protein [Micromonosporaceae bacterium]|nr:YihY/virulence factor BrkB family protein [Micromonosporaceae bacterium]